MRFLRKLRRIITRLVTNAKLESAHKKHRAANNQAYVRIDSIIEQYRANGGLDHPWQYYKLFSLQELLKVKKPRKILELGSGTTTAIFADYVRSDPSATLTVIDEDAHWLKNAQGIAEIEESEQFSLLVRPAHRLQRGTRVSYDYERVEDAEYDFVFIDGPSLHKEKTAINGNIIDLLPRRPETIVVDGRKTVAMFLDEILSDYLCELSDVFGQRYYLGYQYFSVFTNSRQRPDPSA